jgi:hypothetical protein
MGRGVSEFPLIPPDRLPERGAFFLRIGLHIGAAVLTRYDAFAANYFA